MNKVARDAKGRFVSTKNTNTKGENAMNKTIRMTLPTMNNGDQLILTFVDGKPCFKNMQGEVVNVNIYNEVNININEEVEKQGYVLDLGDQKRWIMSQVFKAEHWSGRSKRNRYKAGSGFNFYYSEVVPYEYQWETTIEQLRNITKLSKDREREEEFLNELSLFGVNTVSEMLFELIENLDKIRTKVLNGEMMYKKGQYRNYLTVIDKNKVTADFLCCSHIIHEIINQTNLEKKADMLERFIFDDLLYYFDIFSWKAIPEKNSKTWLDAFKKRGAYYTLKNMLTGGHDCFIQNEYTGELLFGEKAMNYVNAKMKSLKYGEGWKLFGIMKECIKQNHFDFYERMEEIYREIR